MLFASTFPDEFFRQLLKRYAEGAIYVLNIDYFGCF